MAWIEKTKSNGRIYIYLKAYVGKAEFKHLEEKRIFSFGEITKAVQKIHYWSIYPPAMPEELKEYGFGKDDLKTWINTLNSKHSVRI